MLAKAQHDVGLMAAIEKAGGIRNLARLIGLSHVTVYRWKEIPDHHLLKVEEKTGIPRHLLKPAIFIGYRRDDPEAEAMVKKIVDEITKMTDRDGEAE